MQLNYISSDKLRTGNDELDKKIGYLLSLVNGDVSKFLVSNKGSIYCEKVNKNLDSILSGLDEDIRIVAKETLKEVRGILSNILELYSKLKKCSNLTECKSIIPEGLDLLAFDITNFNIILSKCSTSNECEFIISKYGNGLTFNIDTFIILLGVLLNEKSTDKTVRQDSIKYILEKINISGKLTEYNKATLIVHIKSSFKVDGAFMYRTIKGLKLENLHFLTGYLPIRQ